MLLCSQTMSYVQIILFVTVSFGDPWGNFHMAFVAIIDLKNFSDENPNLF